MPVTDEVEKRDLLRPEHELLREVEGLAGEVELEIMYAPRPGYGQVLCRVNWRGKIAHNPFADPIAQIVLRTLARKDRTAGARLHSAGRGEIGSR